MSVLISVDRFMVYKKGDGGSSGEMTSLVETFTRELMRSPADLVLVAGVRLLLTDDDLQGTAAVSAVRELS